MVVSGGVRIVDRVQRLYAAARAHHVKHCRQLFAGESRGGAVSRRDSGQRNGVELGVDRSRRGHDRRRSIVRRQAANSRVSRAHPRTASMVVVVVMTITPVVVFVPVMPAPVSAVMIALVIPLTRFPALSL